MTRLYFRFYHKLGCQKVSGKLENIMTGTQIYRLRRLSGLIPSIFFVFLVTCVLQLSLYELINKVPRSEIKYDQRCSIVNSDVPLWEQPTLLNLPNFRWIMNNESTCKVDSSKKDTRVVLTLIHTARSHFRERLAIRRSWGSMHNYKNWTLRFAFLLGEPDPATVNSVEGFKKLEEEETRLIDEQEKFGDVVIGSFLDSYHNLTYKHMMGYKWVLNFCPEAQFILKVDDDIFIDILQWLDWRTTDLQAVEEGRAVTIPELYCFNYGGYQPHRNKLDKWYVSPEVWPERTYPDYCNGWGYGISVGMIKKLYTATSKVKFFWIDDVYATGSLLREVKREEPNLRLTYLPRSETSVSVRDYRRMCKKKALNGKRQFKSVVYMWRGRYLEYEMMCLWYKILYDRGYIKIHKVNKKKHE